MGDALQFKKFVSEDDLAEAKRKRQEEWEKVRKPDEPEEAPEVDYDPRTLYERLESNRVKKQEEWDDARRLKNMVKGLEDDEIDFLEHVNRQREKEEREKQLEEKLLLAEYKLSMVVDLTKQQESELKQSVQKPTPNLNKPSGKSQKQLLAGIVRKKSTSKNTDSGPTTAKKPKLDTDSSINVETSHKSGALNSKPAAVLLPGIGTYSESETSSSETEDNS